MLTRCSLVMLIFAMLAAPAPAQSSRFTLDDIARIVTVSDAQVSPDGKNIAIVVSRVDLKKDKSPAELVLVNVASGAARSLTPSRDEVSSPQWSADGSQLAFIAPSGDDKDAKPQVWVLPMSGGEARMVTKADNGVDAFALRPDGKAVAYITSDDSPRKQDIKDHHDLFVVGDNDFLTQKAPVASHVWVAPLEGGNAKRLTSGSARDTGSLSWSNDGRYLAFDRIPDAYLGHFLHGRAALLDVQTGEVQLLGGSTWTGSPVFAPTGSDVAYQAAKDNSLAVQSDLAVRSASAQRTLAPQVDRDVQWFAWMPNGRSIAFSAADHVSRDLWISPLDGVAQRVDLGDVDFEEGSVARNGAIAFVAADPNDPSELYYLAPQTHALKRLTTYNTWLAQSDLANSREFTWHNDGFEEDGVLTYPLGYVKGKTYPLALVIHGGPTQSASSTAFSALVQDLAGHGYFVLQPNYRGSDNLGFAYAHAMIGPQVYVGAGTDVVAGVKALIATGMIDPGRIGVSGWSGGGWMTSWLITHYHLWKAAVSGAAVNDCVTQYSLEDVTDYLPALFGGLTPWTPTGMAAYRANSPITFVSSVTAPTLILSDTGDYRVPEPEAYEFFKALRDLGKTVEFVAIPAYGHFPSDPVRRIDTYKRWAQWLERNV